MLAVAFLQPVNAMANARVLVVDDEPDIRQTVKDILEDEGYVVDTAESAAAAREARRLQRPGSSCCSTSGCRISTASACCASGASAAACRVPVIMISRPRHGRDRGRGDAPRRVGFHRETHFAGEAAARRSRARSKRAGSSARTKGLRRQLPAPIEVVGSGKAMQALREQVERIAAHDTWVLIQGEPGTGKETLARALHERSARRTGRS